MPAAQGELAALLGACRRAPADDTPRLIVADWLEDHGDYDRAAFIRIQLELAHPTADPARLRQLKEQQSELLLANAEAWVGELFRIAATAGRRYQFGSVDHDLSAILAAKHSSMRIQRGMFTLYQNTGEHSCSWEEILDGLRSDTAPWIEQVKANYSDFAEFERCTYARHAAGRLAAVVNSNSAPRVRGYDERQRPIVVAAEPPTASAWRRFAHCGNFTALQSLTVGGVDGTGLLSELAGPQAERLTKLVLNCEANLHEAAELAADAPFLNLAEFSFGPLDTAALRTICRGRFPNLQKLDLSAQRVGDVGLVAVCESPLAGTLHSLALQNTGIGDDGIAALAQSPLFARLRGPSLNLMMNRIGDRGLAALADAPGLARFRELVLRENQVGDAGAFALANSPQAANLAYLDFWRNRIGDPGARALARSPYLNAVADLSVKENDVGEDGLLALQERFGERAKG